MRQRRPYRDLPPAGCRGRHVHRHRDGHRAAGGGRVAAHKPP